ncbi:MAG: hypothetical protein E7773_00715 [Sphingomonas sp.]|uniref:hypothetical protein n=1 Tax=Sphingomonas sp. TaxID=28214 RepID=UPI0011FAC4D6|nr:hypothetical protein [Sphingomonas sp.]THD38309.1 MAG: hypothetical protein E7773_00715 [Sphingomonas sp.]
MASKRDIIRVRQSLANEVAQQFLPLEDTANAMAAQAAALVVSLVVGHNEAALPPTAGLDALNHVSEAARLATQARAHVAQAHVALRALPAEFGLDFSQPECPPDFTAVTPLRAV